MTAIDKESLKKFYFSQSSSFGNFKTVHDRKSVRSKETPTPMDDPSVAITPGGDHHQHQHHQPHEGTTHTDVSMLSSIQDDTAAAMAPATAKIGLSGVRSLNSSKTNQSQRQPISLKGPQPNAASPEYFNFLKQQQELQNQHTRLEETINTLENGRRSHQAALNKLRRQASELIAEIENTGDWKLRSKYDIGQLARDCNLSLQTIELTPDQPPQYAGIAQLGSQLTKIRNTYQEKPTFKQYALFVDQGIRRLSLLEKVLADGNLDSTEVARIPDTLVIQLEKQCDLPTLESLVETFEANIERLTFKIEEARKERAAAVDDGEVHVAEELCYNILEAHENMLSQVIAKIEEVDKAIQENVVLESVRSGYYSRTLEEFERLRARSTKLKARCEEDIKRMFALREKVEEVEAQTAQKVLQERSRSDVILTENTKKQEIVFAKMEELEKELEVLERERHREIQKRIAEKDKDEHRKAEFAQFCHVVDEHIVPLERTIRNMDITLHSADVVGEFVSNGFECIREELSNRLSLLKDVKLEAHKEHVEVFRGMLLELGEVVYKKERMIEETDKSIQQAHVQQELLTETFNPNAKKFGDVKKRLLANRDELENDVAELKERAAVALQGFSVSEEALAQAGVEYVHPATEQDHHTLALRARMMEFKAVAQGYVENQSILHEISNFKSELNASKQEIDMMNANTSGTISKTLPMIRAAQRARQK